MLGFHHLLIITGLLSAPLAGAVGSEPLRPYDADTETLDLWHLDEAESPFADQGKSPTPLLGLLNGAHASQAALPGFGKAISFHHQVGGIPGDSSLKGGLLLAQRFLADGPADAAPASFRYFGEDGAFTYEALVRLEEVPEDAQVIALTILSMDGEAGERIFSLRIEHQGFLAFAPLNDGGAGGGAMASLPKAGPHAVKTGEWFHVAVSYDGVENTPNNLKLYWTRIGAEAKAANLIGSGSLICDFNGRRGDLAIGNEARTNEGNAEAEPFPGLIDEVRISAIARHPQDFLLTPRAERVDSVKAQKESRQPKSKAPFSLSLTRVLVDGHDMDLPAQLGAPLNLESGLHRLDFDFGAADYLPPTKILLRSQLQGLDERWRESARGMSLRCEILNAEKQVISESEFQCIGSSSGWVNRVEDSTFVTRFEPLVVQEDGRWLRITLSSGAPETTGTFVIDQLRISQPGETVGSFWSNSDFNEGTNLTSAAGIPDGWSRSGSEPAIAKVITRLADPGMPENNFTLAVVDGSQEDSARWISMQRLDPAEHGGKTLIVSWQETFNVIDGSLQRASYINVPPGEYTFRAVGVTTGTPTESASIAMPIKIRPPFWQRAWFWPLVTALTVCLLAGAILSIMRVRAQRKVREIRFRHALERDRTRIARDMHDDLGSRITGLTTSAALAKRELENDPEKSHRHLDRLTTSARELVIAMDDLVWAVDPTHDNLDQFGTHLSRLGDEVFRDSGIRYRSSIPAELPDIHLGSNLRHHLALAVKESLHNILKHAGPCEARLSLRIEGSRFMIIEIRDHGTGFDPAATSDRRHGQGNLTARLAEVGGSCSVEASPGSGTVVTLTCPIPPNSRYP